MKLAYLGIYFLVSMIHASLKTCNIPNVWKNTLAIAFLKPAEAWGNFSSFCPIYLPPVSKLIEALRLYPSFAFKWHSHYTIRETTTPSSPLHAIKNKIINRFNQSRPYKRTVLVALYLSKPFDAVDKTTLLDDKNYCLVHVCRIKKQEIFLRTHHLPEDQKYE